VNGSYKGEKMRWTGEKKRIALFFTGRAHRTAIAVIRGGKFIEGVDFHGVK